MKEVMIILRPKMYFPTKDALDQAGFHSMTIREIIGRGKCPVHYDYDEGAPVKHRLVAKRMIDMFVRDEDLQKLIDTVVEETVQQMVILQKRRKRPQMQERQKEQRAIRSSLVSVRCPAGMHGMA